MSKPRLGRRGRSTVMRSKPLWLGKFVVARPRADGTHRVVFQIPERLRPSGWSATTPLPLGPPRRGDLDDPGEVARIRADADKLYEKLTTERLGEAPRGKAERSIDTLIATWKGSQAWKDNRPRTNKGYEDSLRQVRAWAEAVGDPDPALITSVQVEELLTLYDDRPTARYHLRKVLRMVMKQAVRLRWRSDNPVDDVKAVMPKTRVAIWEQADVDQYVWAACLAGQPAVAAIILTEWEIGQRLTDVILFRRGAEYRPAHGEFVFEQSKTDEPVAIPVSDRLRAVLEACAPDGELYLYRDAATGRPFPDVSRLSHVLEDIRTRLILPAGGRHLVLRALRHSCVVQLARLGVDIPGIASITGHSLGSAHAILKTYLPRDSAVARAAQEKRGLVASGGQTEN